MRRDLVHGNQPQPTQDEVSMRGAHLAVFVADVSPPNSTMLYLKSTERRSGELERLRLGGYQPRWPASGRDCSWPPARPGSGLVATVERHLVEVGRPDYPRSVGRFDVVLGPDTVVEAVRASMAAYYAPSPAPQRMTAGLLTAPTTVTAAVPVFADLRRRRGRLPLLATDPDPVDPPAGIGG
jgi:hypothetical protein